MRCAYLAVFGLVIGLVVGCSGEQSPSSTEAGPEERGVTAGKPEINKEGVTGKQVRKELDEAVSAVQEYSEQRTEEAMQKAKNQLNVLRARLATMREDAGKLQDSAQAKFEESLQALDEKAQEAEQRLAELGDATEEARTQAQDDLHQALDSLETAYKEAADAFENAGSDSGDDQE